MPNYSIMFKGKRIPLVYDPRKHVCVMCGFHGRTHMHHKQYHENNPVRDTIELCSSCHRAEHYLEKRIALGLPIPERLHEYVRCEKCNLSFVYRGFMKLSCACPKCKKKIRIKERVLE